MLNSAQGRQSVATAGWLAGFYCSGIQGIALPRTQLVDLNLKQAHYAHPSYDAVKVCDMTD